MSNYLIIEDDINKYEIIQQELINIGVRKVDITFTAYVNQASKLLRVNSYDLVVLDLNLPMTKGGKPIHNGGVTLLNKLKNNSHKYNLPTKIIGLTSHSNLKKDYQNFFTNLSFSIYDFEVAGWKDALRNSVNWGIASNSSQQRKADKRIIISVHGIRTLGQWQDSLEQSILNNNLELEVKKYKYNYFSAVQLAIPFFREIVINRLSSELELISDENPNAEITIISHSFGTYATVKALEAIPMSCEMEVKQLILVSSVLKSNYNFRTIKDKLNIKTIINECGYNDNVLILSHYLCLGMGMAGRSGVTGTHVLNRFYKGGHDFFNRSSCFIDKYWIPILSDEVVKYDERDFGIIRENIEIMISTKIIPICLIIGFILYLTTGLYLN